jgi:hypothetical protein
MMPTPWIALLTLFLSLCPLILATGLTDWRALSGGQLEDEIIDMDSLKPEHQNVLHEAMDASADEDYIRENEDIVKEAPAAKVHVKKLFKKLEQKLVKLTHRVANGPLPLEEGSYAAQDEYIMKRWNKVEKTIHSFKKFEHDLVAEKWMSPCNKALSSIYERALSQHGVRNKLKSFLQEPKSDNAQGLKGLVSSHLSSEDREAILKDISVVESNRKGHVLMRRISDGGKLIAVG